LATEPLYQGADFIQFFLIDSCPDSQLIMYINYSSSQFCISCPLAQAIYGSVDSLYPGLYGCQAVGNSHPVIIMGVKIKGKRRESADNLCNIFLSPVGIQYT